MKEAKLYSMNNIMKKKHNSSSVDCCFVITSSSSSSYQDLSKTYSAIEPPTWALLLAESLRAVNHKPYILDANAEKLNKEEILDRIQKINPRLICFVVYGQNINAGTTNMSGATYISNYLKENIQTPIAYIGSHIQALPVETLKNEPSIDFGFTNEGVYALRNILSLPTITNKTIADVNGIVRREREKIIVNFPEKIVPNDRMDIDLPGYAWELLPYKNTPLDMYRSPMWHAEYKQDQRSPYAALQTSLGCRFGCSFCMINLINRNDEDEVGVASNYRGMRFWSPEFIIKEFDKLIDMGVKTIRIVDEMFLLNQQYYVPLCKLLSERNKDDSLRMWSYSRIDTVKRPEILSLVRKAGIKWLCLGIESGDKKVRLEVAKGKFEDVDVVDVIKKVHDADINVMANYIFGLPGDTRETIQKTLNLSKELCTAGWNTYAAMALPGSRLYLEAKSNNIPLPQTYEAFSFHSYDTWPLPTDTLTVLEVLELRDQAFLDYHTHKPFLNMIEKKYGKTASSNIQEMTKIKLKRKILGH